MNRAIRLGILGAGLGSRMQTKAKAKPLAQIGGRSLIERLLAEFQSAGVKRICCALRAELIDAEDRESLPSSPEIDWVFVDTISSLHTLEALIERMGMKEPALFCMADTILRPEDLKKFLSFCSQLAPNSCAVLVTPYVDDEKPLWVQVDKNGDVLKFDGENGQYVTSGMYFLSPKAMASAAKLVQSDVHKMRNFLSSLIEQKTQIKTFVVAKTIDVDHPSDLDQAEEFLRSN
jgi:NDP-sugar pyrophosphorylase family protein